MNPLHSNIKRNSVNSVLLKSGFQMGRESEHTVNKLVDRLIKKERQVKAVDMNQDILRMRIEKEDSLKANMKLFNM